VVGILESISRRDDTGMESRNSSKLVFLGPLAFQEDCLKRIVQLSYIYSKPPNERETILVLIGYATIIDEAPIQIVSDYIPLQAMSHTHYATIIVEDVKKIIKEIEKDNLAIVGIFHTHPRDEAELSYDDIAAWIILQLEINRPIPLLVYSYKNNELGLAYFKPNLLEEIKQQSKTIKINP